MRNVATISEHGHYLLGTHTSDVHYRAFLRYIAKVSDYWLKLKELKVGDKVSIKDAETFCYDCDKLIHKVGDIKEIVQFAITQQKTETKDKLAWLKELKSKVMESLPDETEEKSNN